MSHKFKNQKNLKIVKTKKADFVENQIDELQKMQLKELCRLYIPNFKNFTMTTHLNVIITTKDGEKTLYGHWFMFAIKYLVPVIVGSKYSNTVPLLQNVVNNQNIINVLYKYHNTL